MAKPNNPLSSVPAIGTRVVHIPTEREGEVTSSAGHDGRAYMANVLFEGHPHEDTVYVHTLALAGATR